MNSRYVIPLAALIVILLVVLGSSAFTVRQTQDAVVLRLGDPKDVIRSPGLYFRLPMIDQVVYLDHRVRNFDAPAMELLTADQKRVVISAFVRYKIVEPLTFYRVGRTYDNAEGQIRSVLGSTLRTVIGKVRMADILTPQRARLMKTITDELIQKAAKPYGIEIVDVRFKRVDLPQENSETIFNQMRTQRAQEAAGIRAEGEREAREKRADADKQQILTLAEARRQGQVLRGEGDAEATRIYNEAFGKDSGFFDFYRSMQAMRDGLTGDTTSFVGPPTGDFFRYFGGESEAAGMSGLPGAVAAPEPKMDVEGAASTP